MTHIHDAAEYTSVSGTRQTPEPLHELHLGTDNRLAREAARGVADGSLDLDPPYQRGHRWTLDQRIALVRSWVSGVPVPPITVNDRCTHAWRAANGRTPLDTGLGMWAVVDGKQRCETARMWFAGEFAVPASWFDAADVAEPVVTADGPYVTFDGLTEPARTRFAFRAKLPQSTAQVATVEEEAEVYLLLNGGGTPQTPADMVNAARVAGRTATDGATR